MFFLFGVVQIKHQFMSGSLAHRAQYALEGELNRDFQPVLAAQMVQTMITVVRCCKRVSVN